MKKSNLKKALAIALAASMLPVNVMAEEANTDSWISEEKLEFSMLYEDSAAAPFKEDWLVVKELENRSNVKINYNIVPSSDYESKLRLLLSSGDAPDFITCAEKIDPEFHLNGAILPISDYLDQMPYLKAAIDGADAWDQIDNIRQSDGKFYYVPGIRTELPAYSGLAFRADILADYGMEVPKTVDELYAYLKRYKEENPDSVPLTGAVGIDGFMHFIAPVYGVYAGWSADNGMFYDWYSESFELTYTHERYKECLTFLAKLYAEGLLDPELFTQGDDQWRNKLATGKSVASYMWNGGDRQINPLGQENDPDFSLEMAPPLSALEGITGTTEPYPQLKAGMAMPASAVDDPNFEEKLKYMDWVMNSPEAIEIGNWGIEGDTFEFGENGERLWLIDIYADGTQADYGFCNNSLQPATPVDYELSISMPYMKEVSAYNTENDLFGKVQPTAKFTPDEMEEVKLVGTSLKDYCEKMQQQFIFGTVSIEEEWDNFVAECESRGAADLREMYNAKLEK